MNEKFNPDELPEDLFPDAEIPEAQIHRKRPMETPMATIKISHTAAASR